MQKSILTVSADKEFLEEIRSHLEEGGRFRICSVNSGAEALKIAAIDNFDAAILDAEISDIPFVPFTRDLIYTQPNLKLLIYPPNNNSHHPVIKGLVSHGFLNKPFFAPEVGSSLAAMFNPVPEPESEDGLEAVESIDLEASPLDEIHEEFLDTEIEIPEVETASVDSTITSIDQEQGGYFPEDLLRNEVAEEPLESESLDDTGFVELDSFKSEDEFRELDAFLENMPPPDPDETERLFAESELISTDATSVVDNDLPENFIEQQILTEDLPREEEALPIDLSSMESEVPAKPPEEVVEDLAQDQNKDEVEIDIPGIGLPGQNGTAGELPKEHLLLDNLETSLVPPPLPPILESVILTGDGKPEVDHNIVFEVVKPISESPEESIPGTTPLGVKSIKFEYSCVLIPENQQQFIARDLSDRIGFILPQIHMTSGWRVTSISVRPLYLMWRISLPASTSPRDALCEIRKRITEHLYSNFPELLKNNKEETFWASDYLILSGAQSPSSSLIQEFIHRVRKNQQEPKV